MREIQRTALVPFTPLQMFALVDDFERYPQFLPWVSAATVLERTAETCIGRLTMARAGLHEQFTTRNTLLHPTRLEMVLVEGPFRLLEGVWTFDALVDPSAGTTRGTRVGLNLRFEFKNRVTDLLLAKVFEASCDTLVDAFAKRAKTVYAA